MHGQEKVVFTDTGYQGVDKQADAKVGMTWRIAYKVELIQRAEGAVGAGLR